MSATFRHFVLPALLSTAAALAFALPAFAETTDTSVPHSKTRAEVLADLDIYNQSGLAALERTEDMSDMTPRKLQAKARYEAMRQSPAFAALVQQYAAKLNAGTAQAAAANEQAPAAR